MRLVVNGTPRAVEVASTETLLDALRWDLSLTGSKECCAEGECGACTVLVDGRAVNSCLVLAVEADGMDVTTVEGLESGGGLSPLQDAFLETGAIQCGFCIPGHGRVGPGAPERELRTRPPRTSARVSPATCAAAPATSASSTPSCSPPGQEPA